MVNFLSLEADGWFVDSIKLKNFLQEKYDENISNDKLKSYLLDVSFFVLFFIFKKTICFIG